MKINKKKVMVSALAVAMGAALVGSISGTIAWYQYSTRVTAAMLGTTAGVSRNLQIRLKGDTDAKRRSEVTSTEIATYLAGKDFKNTTLTPISSGTAVASLADGTAPALADFYGNPRYQYANSSDWIEAKNTDFFQVVFEMKGIKNDAQAALPVFVTDLTINDVNSDGTTVKLDSAIRVHFTTTSKNFLLSEAGGTTKVNGKLDLNNDGNFDQAYETATYDFEGESLADINYGGAEATYASTAIDTFKATDTNGVLSGGTKLLDTAADSIVEVTMTVWLEGWAELDALNATSADKRVWSMTKYNAKSFQIGVTFATNAEEIA